MAGDAQVPTSDVDELRVALGRPHSGKVADGPDRKADQPEAQAETEGCGERAIEDGDAPGCAAEQDVLGQGAVNRNGEARHVAAALDRSGHQTSAPPPKLKKLRKNELAAKAIDRPKTI